MNRIYIEEIVKATEGTLIKNGSEKYITGIKHDSRKCNNGDMFVAIIGENQDGHRYVEQAVNAGCRTVLVSDDEFCNEAEGYDCNIIKVNDTVYALGQLAKWYLRKINVKKIGVTGSVGKTSVRDMIYFTLNEKYKCGRNIKNFNNFIGLPLSVFQFDDSYDIVVLEMGMNHSGEIDRLAEIVKPDVGVITNVGITHIENIGSREGIFHAKMEITKHITHSEKSRGYLVFPEDDIYLTRENTRGDYEQVTIGIDGKSSYILSYIDDRDIDGIQFTLEHLGVSNEFSVPVPGRHNAINASIAVAVGQIFDMSMDEIDNGLSKVELTGRRLRKLEGKTLTIIDDTYNASPDSMKSALKVLEATKRKGKKVAILGDMFELGDESMRQHHGVGVFARGVNIDTLVSVGKKAEEIAAGAKCDSLRVFHYEKKEELIKDISKIITQGDLVLVKGSRGMKMEEIVDKLLEM